MSDWQQDDATVDRVAKAIASGLGDDFADAFAGKAEWIAERGIRGGRFRDINEPMQPDYLEAARAVLAALSMTEWQDISTAPKDGTEVLLWQPWAVGLGKCIIGAFRTDYNDEDGEPLWLENDLDDFSTGYASTPATPTHWMPPPAPPGEEP